MAKQPFTNDGVQQKLAELSRLSDTDLTTQTQAISSNFRTWMTDNFSLTSDQDAYLKGLDDAFVGSLGRSMSNALISRVPISFKKDEVPSGASKFIRSRDSITAVHNTNGTIFSGSFEVYIGAE